VATAPSRAVERTVTATSCRLSATALLRDGDSVAADLRRLGLQVGHLPGALEFRIQIDCLWHSAPFDRALGPKSALSAVQSGPVRLVGHSKRGESQSICALAHRRWFSKGP
jgi:hypothetical protein